jgi:hypothetical protein
MTAVKSARPLASLVFVLSLCAGVSACGGDDDDESSETTPPGTEAPAATTEATTAPEPTTPEATTPEPTTPATTEAPAELTASYRGVTADSIKIGVLLLDAQKLLENAGVELN